ncbi:hypothetical protein AAC387_Pa01g2822 [Persea americana]
MAYTRASILSATAEIQDHTKALKTGNTNDSISISFSRFSPIPSLLLCFPLPQISGATHLEERESMLDLVRVYIMEADEDFGGLE